MRMKRKIVGLLLACCIVFPGLIVSAKAAASIGTSGGNGTTTVALTVVPATFSVTVPTSLPVNVAANGTVTCADSGTAKITNSSNGPVKVTGVAITGTGGWTVIDYNANLKHLPVDTKQIALKLNDVTDVTDNSAALASAIGTSGVIVANGEAAITYAANIPAQSTALDGTTVANIVFTIGWDTVS